jgi:hypothetical protein
MKKYVLSVLALWAAISLNAQVRFGLKAGLSSTDIKTEELDLLDQGGAKRLELALRDANYGLHFGVAIQANLGAFVLQPEFNFNSNTVEWDVTDVKTSGVTTQVLKEKFQYMDIPLLAGFRLGPLRLQAGPQGHVFINSKSDLFKFNEYDQKFKDLTVGWIGGAGLDIWKLSVDLRYEGNVNNFGDHIRFAGREYAFSRAPSRWMASVTWFFSNRN